MNKLYFRIESNNDDINMRFEKYAQKSGEIHNIPPYVYITKNLSK
jgi:hypothetical protein